MGLEISSEIKLICVPIHYYWSIPFSVVNSVFFLTFSCVYQTYVAEVLIIHFCYYYHLRFMSLYESWGEVIFCWGRLTLALAPVESVLSHLSLLWGGSTTVPAPVSSMSHLSSLWWWWVTSRSGSSSRSIFGLTFWPEFRVHSGPDSHSIYISP